MFRLSLTGLLLALAALHVAVAVEPSADDLLRARGLQQIGHAWCLPEDAELRRQLTGLERFETHLVAAQQSVDQLIGQNELYRRQMLQFEQLEKDARGLSGTMKAGSPQRIKLDAQAKEAGAAAEQCRRQYIRPEQLGLSPPLKPALADWINIRTETMLRLLPLLSAMDRLTQSYDSLRHDTEVTAAMAAIGPQESLGRMKNLRESWKIVDKLQAMVFSDSMPIAHDGKFYRIAAIVNERQPLTFSYMGTGQQETLIPQNLAEAAGLVVDVRAPKVKVRLAAGRDGMVWPVKAEQLRFGRHVLHNAEVYILAPEDADIGARIGAQAFSRYRVELDVDRLQFVVSGKDRD